MKKAIPLLILVMIGFSACASHRFESNFEFANKLAQEGLWREAVYRWKLALEEEGPRAAIHNNLAIALEHQGKLKEARSRYTRALELDPDNAQIKINLNRLNILIKGKSENHENPENSQKN